MAKNNNWIDLQSNTQGAYCNLHFSNFNVMSKEEAISYNIEQITKKYDNLFVAMSGGISSEFVAESLKKRGIKFKPMIVDFELNSAEVWYAYKWCYENKAAPGIIKLPLETMINQLPQFARHLNTRYISTLELIIEKYASHRSGHVLLGGSSPFTNLSVFKDRLHEPMLDDLNLFSYNFGLDLAFGDKHPSSFITYTPELFYSFVRDVDYLKPTQIAMSEYFGVDPRPQFNQEYNFLLSPELADASKSVNIGSRLYNFSIGKKAEFLEAAARKEVVPCKVTTLSETG